MLPFFVFFLVGGRPLPLCMAMPSFWKASTNTFECRLSWFEPGFLIFGLVHDHSWGASDRRIRLIIIFSMEMCITRRGEYEGSSELRTETVSLGEHGKVPEFQFASSMKTMASPTAAKPQPFNSFDGFLLSFCFYQARRLDDSVVGFCGDSNRFPCRVAQLGNLHRHLNLAVAR